MTEWLVLGYDGRNLITDRFRTYNREDAEWYVRTWSYGGGYASISRASRRGMTCVGYYRNGVFVGTDRLVLTP